MNGNLGSEVLLKVETLSKNNFATTNLLRAPACNWYASECQLVALRRTQTWGIMKDG